MLNQFKKIARKFPRPIKSKLKAVYELIRYISYRLKRRISPPSSPDLAGGKVYLHLGCGDQNDDRYINVDIRPLPHVHYVRDVTDLSVFATDSVDLVYACHVLEHVSHARLGEVIKEWRRVLKEEGILRISVPDFEKIIAIYRGEGKTIESIQACLLGAQNYEANIHRSVFNKKFLSGLLKDAGFSEVREWDPEKEELYTFDDFANKNLYRGENDEREYPISLNLEGVK